MTEKPTVVEALSRVMRDVQAVGKKDRNTEQNYSFRGIDATVNAVGPALREHGVVVLPMLEKATYRDVQTSRGKPSRESTVEVRFRFYGPGGDWLEAVVPGEAMDFGDKGVAKAMSVAYRIVLLQALCIPTDEADPDSHAYERAQEQPSPEQRRLQILTAAGNAIASATTKEQCDRIGQRITENEEVGAITANDAVDLRRQLVARLDELFPQAQTAEQTPEEPK